MHIISKDAVASPSAECMTRGEITPATTPFAVEPTKACSDDAIPRRSGTRSSTSNVTTGTMSAQPKEKMAMGSSAQAG